MIIALTCAVVLACRFAMSFASLRAIHFTCVSTVCPTSTGTRSFRTGRWSLWASKNRHLCQHNCPYHRQCCLCCRFEELASRLQVFWFFVSHNFIKFYIAYSLMDFRHLHLNIQNDATKIKNKYDNSKKKWGKMRNSIKRVGTFIPTPLLKRICYMPCPSRLNVSQ